MTIMDNKNM